MTTGKLFPSGLRIESNLTHKSIEDKFVKQIRKVSIIVCWPLFFRYFVQIMGEEWEKRAEEILLLHHGWDLRKGQVRESKTKIDVVEKEQQLNFHVIKFRNQAKSCFDFVFINLFTLCEKDSFYLFQSIEDLSNVSSATASEVICGIITSLLRDHHMTLNP